MITDDRYKKQASEDERQKTYTKKTKGGVT